MLSDDQIQLIKNYQKNFHLSAMAQHINALLQDREELKQQLTEARSVIEFYGAKANWLLWENQIIKADHFGDKARDFLKKYPEGK